MSKTAVPILEKLSVQATVLKAEENKPRRFRMAAYTGVTFARMWGQMCIALDGMEPLGDIKLPMLLDHEAQPCAVADKAYFEKGEGLVLEGYFLDTPHAKHVCALADQGFPWTASVGVKCLSKFEVAEGSEHEVNGQKLMGPVTVWSRSKLYETSFITAGPADDNTQVEVMTMSKEAASAMAANLPAKSEDEIRVEVLKEHEAKRSSYVEALVAGGAKKSRARGWFDDGIPLEQAFAKHATLMKQAHEQEMENLRESVKKGKIDEQDARRIKAGITKGFDPDAAKKEAEKKDRIREKLEKGQIHKLNKQEKVYLQEKLASYEEWSRRDDEGLLMRSIYPRQAGGHELLHAIERAEDNTALRLRSAEKGLVVTPPYWIGKDTVEKLADALIRGSEQFGGEGLVERLAGTWGRNGHTYSVMTVKGFLSALFKPLEDDMGKGWAQKVGITIPSNQENETHRWLGNPPVVRKWVGNRQTKSIPPYELVIKNDTYEISVDFPLNDFRFDKSGHIMLRMGEMGLRAKQHWDVLGTQVLLTNPTAFDGVALFGTTHTYGGGYTMKNLLTSADVPALSVSNPTNPTSQEMVAAIMAVIQYFFTYEDQTGSPVNGDARHFVVMVPPNLWGPALTAVRAARLNYGQDNPLHEQDYSVEVIPNGWMVTDLVGASTNTNFFYVMRVDSQFRPIVFQDVTGWEAQMLGPGSDLTVMKDRVLYGLRAVRGAGPGEWAHVIKATFN